VHYGHKLNLATGRSGLIFDLVIEAGNPADAECFLPMLERHIASHGIPPRQTTSDGGYASLDNPGKGHGRARRRLPQEARREILSWVTLTIPLSRPSRNLTTRG
jgi:IS5 family transposase